MNKYNVKPFLPVVILFLSVYSLFARDVQILVKDSDLGISLEGAMIHSWDGSRHFCDRNGMAIIPVPDDRQVVIQAGYPEDMRASLDGFYIFNPYYTGGAFSIFDPKYGTERTTFPRVYSSCYGHSISGRTFSQTSANIWYYDTMSGRFGSSYNIDTSQTTKQSDLFFNVQGRIDYDWELGKGFLIAAGLQEMYVKSSSNGEHQGLMEKLLGNFNSEEQDAIFGFMNLGNPDDPLRNFYRDNLMISFPFSYKNENGEFSIIAMDYLGGGFHGWNEYHLDLLGSGIIIFKETEAVLSINPEIETVQISSGRIRSYDTRITGNEALTSLRNRRERILVITNWLNSIEDTPQYSSIKDFEEYWKPLLFPEITYKKKQPIRRIK
ncbi:MAG: hypothetical protein LBH16_02980 [Treponema sp.]|jgi:hypothetical protein|nr:hypothetical protein [Treponema sp.]